MLKMKPFSWDTIDGVIAGFEGRYAHKSKKGAPKSDLIFYKFWMTYLKNLRHAHENGKKIVFHTTNVPNEILYAFDIAPVHIQVSLGISSISGTQQTALNTPLAMGMTPEMCSLCRIPLGFFAEGIFPPPDAFIGNLAVCDYIVKNADLVNHFCGCPTYTIEKPYLYSPNGVAYMVKQFEEVIEFLEQVTGSKLNYDRLEETISYARQVESLHRSINELRKSRPTPMNSRKGPELQLADFYFTGTPLAVEYYQCIYEECAQRVEKKEGAIPNEKYRLLSPYYFPTYGWDLVDHLEKKWGAINVMELFFSPWSDLDFKPKSPLEALAKKYYEHPITKFQNAPIDVLIQEIIREAREYSADAVLWWAHRSCSHMLGAMWSIDKAITEQIGIPILRIDEDYADPVIEPIPKMIDKIDIFFQMLETSGNI